MILSPDQETVAQEAIRMIKDGRPLVTIGGYAGTGKTTITGEIVNRLRDWLKGQPIAFACYTGKAKDVLERKLKACGALQTGDFCGTLHSLIYTPITQEDRRKDEKTDKEHISIDVNFTPNYSDHNYRILIIDEASMVDQFIFQDAKNLGIQILAIGDHGQLPPVASKFNLMEMPMLRLEKIHRQEADNPIIRLSMMARENGEIPVGEYGPGIFKTSDGSVVGKIKDIHEWMIICGTNKKRVRLNGYVRERRFALAPEIPQIGEKLICLQNNHARKVFNGMTGYLKHIEISDGNWFWAKINMGDFEYYGKIFRWQFGYEKTCKETMRQCDEVHPEDFEDLFDYGYALTAHKSQGSEAARVVVYEEKQMRFLQEKFSGPEGWRRWLYTAITRAKEELIIIGE